METRIVGAPFAVFRAFPDSPQNAVCLDLNFNFNMKIIHNNILSSDTSEITNL